MLRNRVESASETTHHGRFNKKKYKKQTKDLALRIDPPLSGERAEEMEENTEV